MELLIDSNYRLHLSHSHSQEKSILVAQHLEPTLQQNSNLSKQPGADGWHPRELKTALSRFIWTLTGVQLAYLDLVRPIVL
jgi:hypothetical protein